MIQEFPSNTLVDWVASEPSLGIVHPLDRPWYKISPTPLAETQAVKCHCKPGMVTIMRYHTKTDEKEQYLFLGQCKDCQRVFFAYQCL